MAWTAPRGTKFRGFYRDTTGQIRGAGTWPTKKQAQIAADAAEAEDRADAPTDTGSMLWKEWLPRWWETRTVQPGTLMREMKAIQLHLLPHWGDTSLADIKRTEVQRWVASLERAGLAATSVAKLRNLLSGSLRAAVAADLIDANPCQGVKLPAPAPLIERYLSDEECDAIRFYLADEQQFLFDLLLGTGMRWGEGLGLHWEDCHLEGSAPYITVVWSFDRMTMGFKVPKSGKSRQVPISRKLTKVLLERRNAHGFGVPVPGMEYRGPRKPHTGPVYDNRNDTEFRYAWRASVRVATVGKGAAKRKVGAARIHDLRHTFASRLVQGGVQLQEVKDILGHSSITQTERYAHLAPSKFRNVRKVLDQ